MHQKMDIAWRTKRLQEWMMEHHEDEFLFSLSVDGLNVSRVGEGVIHPMTMLGAVEALSETIKEIIEKSPDPAAKFALKILAVKYICGLSMDQAEELIGQ